MSEPTEEKKEPKKIRRGACVKRMLELSTFHLPVLPIDEMLGDLSYAETDRGWIVFVGNDEALVPDWFRPIYDYALDECAELVSFDARAPEVEGFEVF